MQTVNAATIAASPAPYKGKPVAFNSQGFDYTGTLDTAHRYTEDGYPSDYVHLTVDGQNVVVNADYTTVTVA